jgi:hypothetical protein
MENNELEKLEKYLEDRFDKLEESMKDIIKVNVENSKELAVYDERFSRIKDISDNNLKEHQILFDSIRKLTDERIVTLEHTASKLTGSLNVIKFLIVPVYGAIIGIIVKLFFR